MVPHRSLEPWLDRRVVQCLPLPTWYFRGFNEFELALLMVDSPSVASERFPRRRSPKIEVTHAFWHVQTGLEG